MSPRARLLTGLALTPALVIVVYMTLHEAGHALAITAAGGQVTDFVLGVNAHVGFTGVGLSLADEAWIRVSGVLLPLLVLVPFAALCPARLPGLLLRGAQLVTVISFAATLVPWVVIPLVSLVTAPPAGDDVTLFLQTSGLPALVLSASTALTLAAVVLLARRAGLAATWTALRHAGRTPDGDVHYADADADADAGSEPDGPEVGAELRR